MTSHLRTAIGSSGALLLLLLGLGSEPARGDQWISYIGGGVDRIDEGEWRVRRGQVLFRQLGGALVSAPARDVDLATSTFLTWQLNGRRGTPPRVPLALSEAPKQPSAQGSPAACVPALVSALVGSETLEVVTEGKPETIHIACLDSPETQHRLPQIAWFGRAALGWLQVVVTPGDEICLTEEIPSQTDGDGHRIVHVTRADGRDYAGEAIAGGFGLLRTETCSRSTHYRKLEDQAIAQAKGFWGPKAEKAALAALSHTGAADSGPPPRRRASGGG